jgi:glyoxylase-like metal-dependent hydrolase (beta-lactamase superfamily II)
LIRPAVQQEEMDKRGAQVIGTFSRNSAQNADLLAGVKLRPPDILFDSEAKLDLGGVSARLLWGAGHTKGDELIFVEPDSALITGDIVQNKVIPAISSEGPTTASWLAILDKLETLHSRYVIPDHSPIGDASLIAKEHTLILELQSAAIALKRQGVSVEDAGKQLTAEFKTKYPDWPSMNPVANFVRRVYAEN